MKEKTIIANWKTNPSSLAEAKKIFKSSDKNNVVITPPFVFLPSGEEALKKSALGAQDVFYAEGAYTGEVSVKMLSSFGVKYVLLGHSERRSLFSETNDLIAKKIQAVVSENMTAVLCIGESSLQKEEGEVAVKRVLKKMIVEALSGFPPKKTSKIIIAYEPVWAIGSSSSLNPLEAGDKARFIKNVLEEIGLFNVSVFYGGSVDSKNALGFLSQSEIDGLLLGSNSLKKEEFVKITAILNNINKVNNRKKVK